MPPVALIPEEKRDRDRMNELIIQMRSMYRDATPQLGAVSELLHQGAPLAVRIHESLERRGITVRHRRYFVRNREQDGMPGSLGFYLNFHALESLENFLKEDTANNDPVVVAMGQTFEFRIYIRRSRSYDIYRFVRIGDGWTVSALSHDGPCDRGGAPILFDALEHDSVNYPKELGEYVSCLWQASEDGCDTHLIQQGFDQLGTWVSECERGTPTGLFDR